MDQATFAPKTAPTTEPAPARGPGTGDGDLSTERVPLLELKSYALYTPDPPVREFQQAKPSEGQGPWRIRVGFCIDEVGITRDLEILDSSGDDGLDEIGLNTVRKWRFRPWQVDGRPTTVCSSVKFTVSFPGG